MLKVKMVMENEEMVVSIAEDCKWNQLASKLVATDWICEGNELPENQMVECLDGYLMADEEGEITEIDRELTVEKNMESMFSFILKDEKTYGCATEKEISNLCKEKDSKVWIQILANFECVLNRSCEGKDIAEGNYLTTDGVACVMDDDISLISNLKLCV